MTYLLAALVVVNLASLVFCLRVCVRMIERLTNAAAEERRSLEDRLVAMTDRDASVLLHSQETHEPGDVRYVDEARELELYGE